MSDIGEIRRYYREWLSTKLRIDNWGLGSPEEIINRDSPPSLGIERPVTSIDISGGASFGGTAIAATIPFAIIYRFDRNYRYSELPRDDAEALLTALICDITTADLCEVRAAEATGRIEVAEDANSDWLIIFELDVRVEFERDQWEYRRSVFN